MSYKTFITGRLTANKLTLNNINKTTFVIFHPYQKRLAYQPKLCMFGNEKNKYVRLEPKVYIKYLRVLIDQNLSLKYHIDSIVTKISKNVVWYPYNETSKLHPAVCSWIWGELSLQYRFCREGNQSKLLQCRRLQTNDNQPWYQGHPTIVFWEISVRSPLEWLKFSRAQEQLKISKMFRGDCLLGSEFRDLCGLFT